MIKTKHKTRKNNKKCTDAYKWFRDDQCYQYYMALEITYQDKSTRSMNDLNFHILAKSSIVAGKLFQNLSILLQKKHLRAFYFRLSHPTRIRKANEYTDYNKFLASNITKKIDINDCSFAHLTLILLLHYLVKSRSCSLALYNNEFILGSARVDSENHCESTKSLKIVTCLTIIVSTFRSCCQT